MKKGELYLLPLLLLWTFGLCPVFAQDLSQLAVKNPIKVSGSLSARSYYSMGSRSPLYRANPFGYGLSGSVTVTLLNGISLPFSVSYSNRQTSFAQPFNQFGMSPTYKGFTLHAGYRNLRFSDYTLNSFTMLGGGLEVQKGLLRVGFMMGRLNKAITSAENRPTTFRRIGYAARVGIGKGQNYLDLIMMQGYDDANSLVDYEKFGLSPAKNTVVGVVINKSFGARLIFNADAAFSIYTGDVNAAKIDPTLLEAQVSPILYKTVDANISSRGVMAVSSSLAYSGKGYGIRAGYQRIDPGFTTMGMYNVNNDLEIISIAPRFNLLKNKVVFNGNLRLQRDNLYSDKLRSTRRFLPSATLSINPSAMFGFMVNANYSTLNQAPGIKQTVTQAVQLMNQANYNLMLMPRLTFINEDISHNLMLSVGTNQLIDNSTDTTFKRNTEYSGLNANFNYGVSLDKQFLSADFGVSYFSLTNIGGTTDNLGMTAGVSKGFLKNKLTTNLSTNYNLSKESNAMSFSASARMKPAKHHRVGLTVYQVMSQDKTAANRNFNEFRGTLDYTYTF